MFVVFEGIDGGGKTTLSNLAAAKLRAAGLRVVHVREGGTFASSVTQALRELGRDARNLVLEPRAELMLYLTREVQLVDEVTRAAIRDADVVIADRYVYTAQALATYGRGMPATEVEPLVHAAMNGLEPELVVLVDVEPTIARARRRVSKILVRDVKPPSRKGLAGTALQRQLREGYRAIAARDPERWLVVDNTDADLDELATALADVIRGASRSRIPATPARQSATTVEAARAALLAWIDRRAEKEPHLAAYFLDGTHGPDFDERREALATRCPAVIASGLTWLDDDVSWRLRHALASTVPYEVARSIEGPPAARQGADALLGQLVSAAPRAVARAIDGRDDDVAWALRERMPLEASVVSLGPLGSARAWQLRERWLKDVNTGDVLQAALACVSLRGLGDDAAWKLRKSLRDTAPVAALESVAMLGDDRSWRWRERFIGRAPKSVMRTIQGMTDERAWMLRDRVAGVCEEVLDTIIGDDSERAWTLREAAVSRWPASALKSLGPLGDGGRRKALISRALELHPSDVAVWRQSVLRTS